MKYPIKALFLDVGGVFLTNGWDHHMRQKAAEMFDLNLKELDERHALTFDTYEIGKITLDEYLKRVVFYTSRSFSFQDFKDFMFKQSQPYPQMIELIKHFKKKYHLQTTVISNEGRELSDHRIHAFDLKKFIDIFVISAFLNLRKPDTAIYLKALDLSQMAPQEVIYIDDRLMLVEIAHQLGMHAIHHTTLEATQQALESFLS